MEFLNENPAICLVGILTALLATTNYFVYKKKPGAEGTSLWMFLVMLILTASLPVVIVFTTGFLFYRQVVVLLLYVKHGTNFGGLLDSGSCVHAWKGATETPAHCLLILQYEQTDSQDFYEFAEEAVRKTFKNKLHKSLKISATLESFLGYFYLLRNQITPNDCLKKLKMFNSGSGEIDKADLLKYLGEMSDVPLPKNRKALWELLIGTQPIKWENTGKNDRIKCYPVIVRFNHSLTDVEHFLKGFQAIFGDKETITGKFGHCDNPAKKNLLRTRNIVTTRLLQASQKLIAKLKSFFLNAYLTCLLPSFYPLDEDSNVLHGPSLINRKLFSMKIVESADYKRIIKHVKAKFPTATFTDIFLTAVTASLKEYFEKNSTNVPSDISVTIPSQPKMKAISQSSQTHSSGKRVACRNTFSTIFPKLPVLIDCDDASTPLLRRLQIIGKRMDISRKSWDYEAYDCLLNSVAGLIPHPFAHFVARALSRGTVLISNMPGLPSLKVLEGCPLQEMVFWPANRELTGVALAIHTYDGRLQMGLAVDKILIPEQSQVDNLLENVYKYLQLLDCESEYFSYNRVTISN